MEPRKSTVTVTMHPGQILGLVLGSPCNNVCEIRPGVIEDLNKARPGTVEVGDIIHEVNGEDGPASALIRAWAARLTDATGTLRLTVLRPVEFEVAIDISEGGALGINFGAAGFVGKVASEGMVASYNAMQDAKGAASLLAGDRVTHVNGRAPHTKYGDVMPYLRLALCGGESPLVLRVRRGETIFFPEKPSSRPSERRSAPLRQRLERGCQYVKHVLAPAAARSLRALRTRRRRTIQPDCSAEPVRHDYKRRSSVSSESSTRAESSPSSPDSKSSDLHFEHVSEPSLTLPGVIRREPSLTLPGVIRRTSKY
jgi:hypothetical protein